MSNKADVPNKTEDLNLSVFNVTTGINKSTKHQQRIYHVNVNVNLMEENVIQINGGIMIKMDVRVKNVVYMKKTISGILLHVVVKMENIWQVL